MENNRCSGNTDELAAVLRCLVTREEAAAILGVRPQTLATWACTRRYALPFVRIGRRVMYRMRDLQAFIDANLVTQEAA